jgi:hypothetical protein
VYRSLKRSSDFVLGLLLGLFGRKATQHFKIKKTMATYCFAYCGDRRSKSMIQSRNARQANTITCCAIRIGSWPAKCFLFFFIILWSLHLCVIYVSLSEVITLGAALEDFKSQSSSKASKIATSSSKVVHSNNNTIHSTAKKQDVIHSTAKKQDVNSENSSNKPTFIIHLGPSKTGTTALQCALIFAFINDQDRQYFESDKYTYIGTLPNECRSSVKKPDQGRFLIHNPGQLFLNHGKRKWVNLQAWRTTLDDSHIYRSEVGRLFDYTVEEGKIEMAKEWTKKLETLHAAQQNGILVFEALDRCTPKHIQALAESLLPHWNVQIVANYRHMYEWLPSFYSEMTRIRSATSYQFAPDNSTDLLPFDLEQRGFFTTMVQDLERRQKHPVEIVTERFAEFFDNITVLNIHEFASEQAYKEELFCNVIPGMTHTCNALKEHQLDLRHGGMANPSFEFDYDMLANAAHKQGLIDSSKIKRSNAFSLAKQRQEEVLNATAKDFPLICLPKATIDRLYQLSLANVQRIFPNNPSLQANHDKGFQSLVRRNKFCHVDTQEVLKDPEWREFFQTIQPYQRLLIQPYTNNQTTSE